MMKKIINYINICHIVLYKIIDKCSDKNIDKCSDKNYREDRI